jgi:hypothetical protein
VVGTFHSGGLTAYQQWLVPKLPLPYKVPVVVGLNAYDRVTSEMFGLAGSN